MQSRQTPFVFLSLFQHAIIDLPPIFLEKASCIFAKWLHRVVFCRPDGEWEVVLLHAERTLLRRLCGREHAGNDATATCGAKFHNTLTEKTQHNTKQLKTKDEKVRTFLLFRYSFSL